MSDQEAAGNPMFEGSEPTGIGTGDVGERKAGADPTAQDATRAGGKDDDELAYDPAQEHRPQAGEQGGQPNLSPDPAVAGRRSNLGQGSTDDSPGTPSGI
ncbi:hypothetical protein [Actinoplanes sp. DH11]|uniref:hypothetical protein n=1 Tax=Actinoplanes sp. DH11 TaxID=2857011 RepID=UPI001E5AEE97|nr:hypothetical protein [Actinoplanes sp. DH11]